MRDGAEFQEVDLAGAKIGGSLQLQGSTFAGAFNLTSGKITEDLILSQGKDVPTWTTEAHLILRNVSVGAIQDRFDAWDNLDDRLELSGFTYQRLGGLRAKVGHTMADRSVDELLKWLGKQRDFKKRYDPQPFQQLEIPCTTQGASIKPTGSRSRPTIITVMHQKLPS